MANHFCKNFLRPNV